MYFESAEAFNKRKSGNFRREYQLPTMIVIINIHPDHLLSDYHMLYTKSSILCVLFYKSPMKYLLSCLYRDIKKNVSFKSFNGVPKIIKLINIRV